MQLGDRSFGDGVNADVVKDALFLERCYVCQVA